jgi:vitamin K-dependent gamma-carboxylase
VSALRRRLEAPVDVASLAAFRALFGAMMFLGVVRFAARGWIRDFYLTPTHFFTYPGLGWVRPLPAPAMYALFALMGVAALGLCVGWRTRASALVFALAFTYVELIDKTLYLNHYYLVSLLSFLLVALPAGAAFSLDARRDPSPARATMPAWMLWLLRAQLGMVYFFAGVAKLNPDWLLRAEPLHTWLLARTDMPVLGPLFRYRATAFGFSYAGLLFDLFVAFALCHRRARPYAYAAVVLFHGLTAWLFRIGIFPWVMMVCTTVFFDPSWPRRWVNAPRRPPRDDPPATASRGLLLATVYLAAQALLPFRYLLYPGNTLWTEQGFRLSWRVMLTEKSGDVEFRVRDPRTGQRWTVPPTDFLTPSQARMMATVPDMVVQAAGMVRDDFARRGHPGVVVTAEAFASLNGHPARRLIDPAVDLGRERDSLAPKPWITP